MKITEAEQLALKETPLKITRAQIREPDKDGMCRISVIVEVQGPMPQWLAGTPHQVQDGPVDCVLYIPRPQTVEQIRGD